MTIGLVFYNSRRGADIETTSTGRLAEGDPLFTSALISLFTRRQSDGLSGTALPNVPQGWHGDTYRSRPLGSRLWTLRDRKLDEETVRLAQLYSVECLSWWVNRGIASSLNIPVSQRDETTIEIHVQADRPDGSRWDYAWDQVRLYAL